MIFPVTDAAWAQQKQTLLARIAEHHTALEQASSVDAVRYTQGQIAELRWLLGEVEPPMREGSGRADYR